MQTGAEHLVEIDNRLHCFFLPHDLFPQRTLKLASCGTLLPRVQFFPLRRGHCCDHNCSFTDQVQVTRDPFVVHFSELSSDSLSCRSLLIHSRMYGGQFLICTSASHLARKMTASRSTKVRSFRSRTIRRPSVSASNSLSNSATLFPSIRPLSLKIASPFAALVIRSIRPLSGSLTSRDVRHTGRLKANISPLVIL